MKTRNLIIIGSGPAAWTAAIYAARAQLNPLVLAGEQNGGQLMNTTLVENFPGFPKGILGPELMDNMRQQAINLGVEIIDKNVTSIQKIGGVARVGTPSSTRSLRDRSSGSEDACLPARQVGRGATRRQDPETFFETKAVIIATGATANTLKLPGEKKLMGRGVGVCAVCDAPLYKNASRVFVIGGGDTAIEEAMALAKYAKEVIILVRKEKMRATPITQDQLKKYQNIKIWYKTEVKELIGNQKLEKIKIINNGAEKIIPSKGLFYAIGHTPATQFLAGSGVKLDDKGYIFVQGDQDHTSTNIPGIFAAGDCVDPYYRQAIVAAGMGAMAALDTQHYLELQK